MGSYESQSYKMLTKFRAQRIPYMPVQPFQSNNTVVCIVKS